MKKSNIKEYIFQIGNLIILLAFTIIIFVSFTVFRFKQKIDEDFWIITIVGFALLIMTFFSKAHDGRKKAQESSEFMEARIQRTKHARKILGVDYDKDGNAHFGIGNVKEFEDFIKSCNDKNIIAYNTNLFAKYGLSYQEFKQDNLPETLTKKQKRFIKKYKAGKYRLKKQLIAATFLSGIEHPLPYQTKNRENLYFYMNAAFQIFKFVLHAAFMGFIVIEPGGFSITALVRIFMWAGIVTFAAVRAYIVGYQTIIKYRKDYIVSQISIMAQFFGRLNDNRDNQIKFNAIDNISLKLMSN